LKHFVDVTETKYTLLIFVYVVCLRYISTKNYLNLFMRDCYISVVADH